MLGEADLKDIFFAEPIKTPSQQNTVKCNYTFCGLGFPPTVV